MAAENEFVLTRVFEAPRSLVFQAWTDSKHLDQWWGPRIMKNRSQVDARKGGAYRLTMIAPDGDEYTMTGVYTDFVANERLVYTSNLSEHPESWHDLIDPRRDKSRGRPSYDVLNTVTFEERAGKTTVTVRMRFETPAQLAAFTKNGMRDGWSQSFDRLAEELSQGRALVATRLLDAPRDLVWSVWTEPEHIARWWGPDGFKNTIHEMEVRPGGEWSFIMHGPDGTDYRNHIVYDEVVKPERLAYTHGPTPKFTVLVTFTEVDRKTEVTMRGLFGSAADRAQTIKVFKADVGMQQNIDRLAKYVAQLA